jgi:hypothetical protein
MLPPTSPPRRSYCAWLLAVFLHAGSPAQISAQQARPAHSARIALGPRACGCADGRHFAIGASVFGKNSARVVITGFRAGLSESIPGSKPAPCLDLLVLGQVVQLASAQDGRPFLRRQSLKRGIIHGICETKIQFVQAKRLYDFFSDGGSAVTLTEQDVDAPSIPEDSNGAVSSVPDETSHVGADEIELDENLTGRDLLQLTRTRTKVFRGWSPDRPGDATFDGEDLKEGAYFVCRRRLKAVLVENSPFQRVSTSPTTAPTGKQEISILAGTLGRIEKSAGFRSEPLWVAEILPDSAPIPLLRSLISLSRELGGPREPEPPRKVILAASDVVEINQFLDRSGAEWTRLGEVSEASSAAEQGTIGLPILYSRPVLPLEENLTTSERIGALAAVQEVTRGLRLVFKNPKTITQRRTLVFDERAPHGAHGDAVPDLLRRQCFLGMDRLGGSQNSATQDSTRPALFVTGADIGVFRPKDSSQVPPSYYAIDLQLRLQPNFGLKQVPLVCRFPLASIDLALVDMAQDILSTGFEFHRETSEAWPKH